jgi:hypothetical protein
MVFPFRLSQKARSNPHLCALSGLQLGVFRFGFFQNGDVGVGVFPESQKIFVGSEWP